jgi:hypothetical protein
VHQVAGDGYSLLHLLHLLRRRLHRVLHEGKRHLRLCRLLLLLLHLHLLLLHLHLLLLLLLLHLHLHLLLLLLLHSGGAEPLEPLRPSCAGRRHRSRGETKGAFFWCTKVLL